MAYGWRGRAARRGRASVGSGAMAKMGGSCSEASGAHSVERRARKREVAGAVSVWKEREGDVARWRLMLQKVN